MTDHITSSPIVSIIVPTYNRAPSLRRALDSVSKVTYPHQQFEVVIVDNNSNDNTPQVAKELEDTGLTVRYVKESRLSFTVARHTGASTARGKILTYIDDDVVVEPDWLSHVVQVFQDDESVGIVGGRIVPIYEADPPKWLDINSDLVGWLSLLDLGPEVQESPVAFGPNFSVRKDVLDQVGGFPADTIGVEAEARPGVVEKIYVGNGDVGLCKKVKDAGYKVMYSPALVHHMIPPVRLTKQWWKSRFAGEACVHALMAQLEMVETRQQLLIKSLRSGKRGIGNLLIALKTFMNGKKWEEYQLWATYYFSRAKVEFALFRRPNLAEKLWDASMSGVPPQSLGNLRRLLP